MARAPSVSPSESVISFSRRDSAGVEANGIFGEIGGDLRGNCSHAAGRQGDVAFREHFENEFEHAARGSELAVQKDPAEKRPEEAVNEFVGKARQFESIADAGFRAAEDLGDGRAAKARAETQHPQVVPKRTEARAERSAPSAGTTPRIGKLVEPPGKPGKSAGREFPEVQRRIVERALRFRVGGEQDLKAAVEQEALLFVGAHAAADSVRGFHDLEGDSGVGETSAARESGQS